MDNKEKEDALVDEQIDIQWKVMQRLSILISAKWDSNTVKLELESLMKQFDKIMEELNGFT